MLIYYLGFNELVRRGFHVSAYDQRDAGQSTRFPDTGAAASPIPAVLRRRSPALRHPGRVRSITSSASLPGDAGRLGAARYVRLGTVARLARLARDEVPRRP